MFSRFHSAGILPRLSPNPEEKVYLLSFPLAEERLSRSVWLSPPRSIPLLINIVLFLLWIGKYPARSRDSRRARWTWGMEINWALRCPPLRLRLAKNLCQIASGCESAKFTVCRFAVFVAVEWDSFAVRALIFAIKRLHINRYMESANCLILNVERSKCLQASIFNTLKSAFRREVIQRRNYGSALVPIFHSLAGMKTRNFSHLTGIDGMSIYHKAAAMSETLFKTSKSGEKWSWAAFAGKTKRACRASMRNISLAPFQKFTQLARRLSEAFTLADVPRKPFALIARNEMTRQ